MSNSGWISLGVVLLCAAWFGWRGYQQGALQIGRRLLALIFAYTACYTETVPLAHWLQHNLHWPMVYAYGAALFGLFFFALLLSDYLLGFAISAMEEQGVDPGQKPGAAIGVLMGLVLGLLFAWIGGLLWDARQLRNQGLVAVKTQDPVRSVVGHTVGTALGAALEQKMPADSVVPKLATQFVSDPLQLSQQAIGLGQSEALRALFSDPGAQHLLLRNELALLQRHPNFIELMALPQTVALLSVMSSEQDSMPASSDAERAASLLCRMFQSVYRVQQDPRFIALVQTPAYKELAQQQNALAMLSNPAFGELAEILLDDSAPMPPLPPAPGSAGADGVSGEQSIPKYQLVDPTMREGEGEMVSSGEEEIIFTEEALPYDEELGDPDAISAMKGSNVNSGIVEGSADVRLMYRWVDENGRRHFDEVRPPDRYEVEIIEIHPEQESFSTE